MASFTHWPETMPRVLARQEREDRAARRKMFKTLVAVVAFWAACGWLTVAMVDALRGIR